MQLKFKKTLTSLLILTPLVITPVILLSNSTSFEDVITPITKSTSSYVLDETITDMWSMDDTTIAKTTNGDVYSWGRNDKSQTGLGGTTNVSTPTLLLDASEPAQSKGNFTNLAIGETIIDAWTMENTIIVKTTNGDVYSWGRNDFGQTGLGTTTNVLTPTLLLDTSDPTKSKGNFVNLSQNQTIIDAWTMNDATIAKTTNGDVYSWGIGGEAQVGQGALTNVLTPTLLLDTFDSSNSKGAFTSLSESETITDAWTMGKTTIAKTTNGDVYSWGSSYQGQAGQGGTTNVSTPTLLLDASEPAQSKGNFTSLLVGETIVDAWMMNDATIAKTTNGDVFSWGSNIVSQSGLGGTTNVSTPTLLLDASDPTQSKGDFTSLLVGETIVDAWTMSFTTIAKTTNGDVFSWGYAGYGEVGLGGTTNVSTPTILLDASIPGNSKGEFTSLLPSETITDMWSMTNTTIAKATNGDVFTWGNNNNHQTGLENNSLAYVVTPTLLLDTSDPTQSSGEFKNFSSNETIIDAWTMNDTLIAKTTNGDVYSWGSNLVYQTGIGMIFDGVLSPTLLFDRIPPIDPVDPIDPVVPVAPKDPVTPEVPSASSGGMSTGALIGIIIGSIVGVAVIGFGVWWYIKKIK